MERDQQCILRDVAADEAAIDVQIEQELIQVEGSDENLNFLNYLQSR